MSVEFCLKQPVSELLWSRDEISKAVSAFDKAVQIEAIMKTHITRLIQSTLLHEKFPSIIPKYRLIYPITNLLEETDNCQFLQRINQDILSLLNKKEEMNGQLAKEIGETYALVQSYIEIPLCFSEFLQLRTFLHLYHHYLSSWKNERGSEYVAETLSQLNINDLKTTSFALLNYKTQFSALEYFAVVMAVSQIKPNINSTIEIDPFHKPLLIGEFIENGSIHQQVNEAIDKGEKIKARYLSATEVDEKCRVISDIFNYKDQMGRYPIPHSFILDSYCFMTLHGNDKGHMYKTLALNHIEMISKININNFITCEIQFLDDSVSCSIL